MNLWADTNVSEEHGDSIFSSEHSNACFRRRENLVSHLVRKLLVYGGVRARKSRKLSRSHEVRTSGKHVTVMTVNEARLRSAMRQDATRYRRAAATQSQGIKQAGEPQVAAICAHVSVISLDYSWPQFAQSFCWQASTFRPIEPGSGLSNTTRPTGCVFYHSLHIILIRRPILFVSHYFYGWFLPYLAILKSKWENL